MAFRIAIDLGLHLDCSRLRINGHITEEESKVRDSTFWGCYIFDQGWSFYLGRPPAIHESDIDLTFPRFCKEDAVKWVPIYEGETHHSNLILEFYPKNTLTAIILIYLILKEIILSVYRQKKESEIKINYRKSLEQCYGLLLEWQNELPDYLLYKDTHMHPAVIMLHTMYHSAIIFLFRPFFKLSGENWNYTTIPDPLEASTKSASKILNLLSKYKQLFSLRRILNLATYVTSTASTVYLAMSSFQDSNLTAEKSLCETLLLDLEEPWPQAHAIHEKITNRSEAVNQLNGNETILRGEYEDYQWPMQNFELDDIIFGNNVYIDINEFNLQ